MKKSNSTFEERSMELDRQWRSAFPIHALRSAADSSPDFYSARLAVQVPSFSPLAQEPFMSKSVPE